MVREGILHHQEALNERPQSWAPTLSNTCTMLCAFACIVTGRHGRPAEQLRCLSRKRSERGASRIHGVAKAEAVLLLL
jgi:hypothetical protein